MPRSDQAALQVVIMFTEYSTARLKIKGSCGLTCIQPRQHPSWPNMERPDGYGVLRTRPRPSRKKRYSPERRLEVARHTEIEGMRALSIAKDTCKHLTLPRCIQCIRTIDMASAHKVSSAIRASNSYSTPYTVESFHGCVVSVLPCLITTSSLLVSKVFYYLTPFVLLTEPSVNFDSVQIQRAKSYYDDWRRTMVQLAFHMPFALDINTLSQAAGSLGQRPL